MNFDTNDRSVWLEHTESQKFDMDFYKNTSKNEDVEAPLIFWGKIQAVFKALKIKTLKDLSNGENLRHDHLLSILHNACKDEHNLICSHYKWSGDSTESKENNRRMDIAGDFAYELDQIADLKKLPKNTVLYRVKHENKNRNFYTYFYIVGGEAVKLHLRCYGFKFGVLDENPYHHFYHQLGKDLFNDEDWFNEKDL